MDLFVETALEDFRNFDVHVCVGIFLMRACSVWFGLFGLHVCLFFFASEGAFHSEMLSFVAFQTNPKKHQIHSVLLQVQRIFFLLFWMRGLVRGMRYLIQGAFS